jgi:hypothetical protein
MLLYFYGYCPKQNSIYSLFKDVLINSQVVLHDQYRPIVFLVLNIKFENTKTIRLRQTTKDVYCNP